MNEEELNRFYKVSELDRRDVLKWCSEAGVQEEEFIKVQSNTAKYAWQNLFYALYELFNLKDFWRLFFIFWIGLGLILYFTK